MITKSDAERIVESLIDDTYPTRTGDDKVVIVPDLTLERDFGWAFQISTAEYLRTRNPRHGLVGAGPILVLREDGSYIKFSSAHSRESALRAWEADPDSFTARSLPNP